MVIPFGIDYDVHQLSHRTLTTQTEPPVEPKIITTTIEDGSVPFLYPVIDFGIVPGDDWDMITWKRKVAFESRIETAEIVRTGHSSERKRSNRFRVSSVDEQNFKTLVRFLNTKVIKYRDHLHLLKILELGNRFHCPDLIIHCVRELDLQFTCDTVIDVFRSLCYYSSVLTGCKSEVASNHEKRKMKYQFTCNSHLVTANEYMVALLNNSLQLIDMHAEFILTKDQIRDLRYDELEMIVQRNSLQLHSEVVLFTCLADWSIEECKRMHFNASAENRRFVLGPLCYSTRYLTMTIKEFRRVIEKPQILDTVNILVINEGIEKKTRN